MILLGGILSEPPLRLVIDRLRELGAEIVTLNQRRFPHCAVRLEISKGRVGGVLDVDGTAYPLARFAGAYLRLIDDLELPELGGESEDSALARKCRGIHDTLLRWMDVAPGCMINRSSPSASNMSKPFQAQIVRRVGFRIPETLITTDPEAVRAFRAAHSRIIYKSISGTRSVVQTINAEDLDRLDDIRWCPTQFQAFVEGTEVRVHVVGNQTFAAAVRTEATDYRYAVQQTGKPAELRPVILSDELAARCVRLNQTIGLEISGIDLKVTPDDQVYCFEVNPSPAFSYYEQHTGLPIAQAIAEHLLSGQRSV